MAIKSKINGYHIWGEQCFKKCLKSASRVSHWGAQPLCSLWRRFEFLYRFINHTSRSGSHPSKLPHTQTIIIPGPPPYVMVQGKSGRHPFRTVAWTTPWRSHPEETVIITKAFDLCLHYCMKRNAGVTT